MNNPEYVIVNGRKYKINTDYRIALKYNEIVQDEDISPYEKVLGGILMFYGEVGLAFPEDLEELSKGILTFLKGRPSSVTGKQAKPNVVKDMDYNKDFGLIVASMRSDYGIDIEKEKIHWWTFFDYLNGLSTECALNKVREIRRRDLSKEKDREEKSRIKELKDLYSLEEKKVDLNKEQIQGVETFYQLTGIERKE